MRPRGLPAPPLPAVTFHPRRLPAPRLGPVGFRAPEICVSQIVALSVLGAAPGAPLTGHLHGLVDGHLRASGVPYAILQPTGFMQNLLRDLRGDRFHGSWGESRANHIGAADIAAVAAALLTAPVGPSADRVLTGPGSPTAREIAAAMSAVAGRPITYVDLPVPEMAARPAGEGVPEPWATEPAATQASIGPGWARGGRGSPRPYGT
uniref:hypothetical protein n=1 Tax=Nonomuraea pusilla TaxID=46177 RepID=UPI0006E15961|nr:hypothetical protein [Nonomuraea pusilla]